MKGENLSNWTGGRPSDGGFSGSCLYLYTSETMRLTVPWEISPYRALCYICMP